MASCCLVAELETLGGHCLLLCGLDGTLYQGASSVGERVMSAPGCNIIPLFSSYLQCHQDKKEEVSTKTLQELFNAKYSDLVKEEARKMPYAKLQQLGIVFKDLPDDLLREVGRVPRKPALYGTGQRRKLWQTRHQWTLSVSFSMDTSSPANDAPSTSDAITNVPSIIRASPSTAITDTTTAPVSGRTLSLCTANSLPTNSFSSVPVSDTTTTIYNVSVPAVVQPSEIHSSTLPFGDSPSSVYSTFVPPNQATTRVQVRPPTSTRPCGPLHRQPPSQTGFIIPQGTEFGMMLPDTSSRIHAVCVLTSRTQMHGRSVAQGNVVVEILRVLNPALHPIFPGAFDEEEPVCVGGFYEWPCSQLKFMNHD
ncbi:uncharacterized protein [Montipora foliosa]|uniref:uncharacterized protein n=1 Tax=Montipora foliosa TaxID=591990 RepID=UPI0035F12343